jgi:hypothetical protein
MKKLLILLILLPSYCYANDTGSDGVPPTWIAAEQDKLNTEAHSPRKVVDSECYTNCMVDGQPQLQCDNECSHYEEN